MAQHETEVAQLKDELARLNALKTRYSVYSARSELYSAASNSSPCASKSKDRNSRITSSITFSSAAGDDDNNRDDNDDVDHGPVPKVASEATVGLEPHVHSNRFSSESGGLTETTSVRMSASNLFGGAQDLKSTPLQRFVDGRFDQACSVLIMLNVVLVFLQLQYSGYLSGLQLGLEDRGKWATGSTELVFQAAEHVFSLLFAAELVLRLAVFRCNFFYAEGRFNRYNLFDFLMVLCTSFDLYVAQGALGGVNLNVLRPFRFLRLLRTLRVMQSVRLFDKLKILVNTVFASLMALFWSILLLCLVMLMGSLFLCQSVSSVFENEAVDMETKVWVFRMYGTATRSFYTMFELTFSGGWPNYARRLVEDVSPLYACFFFVYIVTVVFAMFRIISALFLKDTLAVAASDAETAVREKMRQKQMYAKKLQDFFDAADTSNDGYLTLMEFKEAIRDDKVRTWLSVMEIDVYETQEFFNILAMGDGLVSSAEFVQGILRLKGGARSQDVISIMRSNQRILTELGQVHDRCEEVGAKCDQLAEALADLRKADLRKEDRPRSRGRSAAVL